MLWMKTIFCEITFLGRQVVYCCAGRFTMAETCTLLPQHRRFVGIDLDSGCVAYSLPQLALVFTRQVLKKE